jgi:hypothetical protein
MIITLRKNSLACATGELYLDPVRQVGVCCIPALVSGEDIIGYVFPLVEHRDTGWLES